MSQDAGYLYILRTDAVGTPAPAAYRVTFTPEGNRDVYLHCEDGLRSFLKDADITAGHIEQAVSALREDPERVIEDVRLTPHQVTTLGFWSDATAELMCVYCTEAPACDHEPTRVQPVAACTARSAGTPLRPSRGARLRLRARECSLAGRSRSHPSPTRRR